MAYTTQYIGSRYVPMFADPAEWNSTRTYEPLTVVLHEGNSFTSRQFVPVGTDIGNEDYWLETGNYNAQVEQYRQEVNRYNAQVSDIDTAYKAADTSITDAYKAADSSITDAYKAADTKLSTDITSAYKAADTKISSDITDAYKAADTKISSDITDAYKAADTKISSDITAAYKAADSTLAAHFPIKSNDIAAGAITRDKLDAQALESIIKGITIRRFDNNDNTADNTGLVVPSNSTLAGFYIPELTMLVITNFITNYGQSIGSYNDISSAVEFKLPSYVPHPTTNLQVNAIGIIYASGTDFKTWTGIGITRTGYVGVNTPINSSDNTALAMAGNAVVFLRAYGAA